MTGAVRVPIVIKGSLIMCEEKTGVSEDKSITAARLNQDVPERILGRPESGSECDSTSLGPETLSWRDIVHVPQSVHAAC